MSPTWVRREPHRAGPCTHLHEEGGLQARESPWGTGVPHPGAGGLLGRSSLHSSGGEGARTAKLTAAEKKLCWSRTSVPHAGSASQERPREGQGEGDAPGCCAQEQPLGEAVHKAISGEETGN